MNTITILPTPARSHIVVWSKANSQEARYAAQEQ